MTTFNFPSIFVLLVGLIFPAVAMASLYLQQFERHEEDLLRLYVGIEDVNDLIADLEHALRTGPA